MITMILIEWNSMVMKLLKTNAGNLGMITQKWPRRAEAIGSVAINADVAQV